ncbi:metal-dependent hydrolase [Jeongeupia wiesaeckerbachi]|uniref:metal-dependent hydrolase n=1 Tax=Jeongeupia wiesaeckerbachi TaxID=3051218 RepID=UPI003D8047A6
MLAKTHVVAGVFCMALAGHYLGYVPSGTELIVAGAAALLPDIDHPKSTLGRWLPGISGAIAKLFGHRGITHSLLAILALAYGLLQAQLADQAWVRAICIGALSHLAGDLLTPRGVPLLWPWRHRFSLPLLVTGSVVEKALLLAMVGGTFYLLGGQHTAIYRLIVRGAGHGLRELHSFHGVLLG